MTLVSIPHAIHYYQHFPLLHTFFEDLGIQVTVSPPTNREIITLGTRVVADITCLPIKIFAGHVVWLRDNVDSDYVFCPAIWSIEPSGYHCAKIKALPDILRSTIPNCPPLLDITIDPRELKITQQQAFMQLGRKLGCNYFRTRRAWQDALQVDQAFRQRIIVRQMTFEEALEEYLHPEIKVEPASQQPRSLTIGVLGHPYCLHDDYINHGMLSRLRALGVRLLTGEMVSRSEVQEGIHMTAHRRRWFYEDIVSGAAGKFLLDPQVDGVIAALAFGCGPDSVMVETIGRRAHMLGRPMMSLVLDEHGSATGMVTRLEAFIDMLARQKKAGIRFQPPPPDKPFYQLVNAPNVVHHHPVVGFPRLGTTYVPIQSLVRGIGAAIELGPLPSKQTVALGSRHSPEFICTPYKQVLGNMIEMLEAGANQLVYVDGEDLCRNSNYALMMNDALCDLGYKFQMYTFDQIFDGGILALPQFLERFAPRVSWRTIVHEIWLALRKMQILDQIERRVQYVRPREPSYGGADKLWDESILRVDQAKTQEELMSTRQDILNKLDRLPTDPRRNPVRIVLTGEYYAILDPFYNQDLEKELGRLGAEVHRSLMMSDWLKGTLILEALGYPRRPEIRKAAKPYLRWDISGEGWVTIGQAVIYANKDFDGLVETMPFTCEPEVVALNIVPQVSREHNLPVLTFMYDEQTGKAGMRTRMEAFVDLLARRRQARRDGKLAQVPPRRVTMPRHRSCRDCPVVEQCQVQVPSVSCQGELQ